MAGGEDGGRGDGGGGSGEGGGGGAFGDFNLFGDSWLE